MNPTLLFFASVGLEQEEEEGEGKRNTEQTQESQVKEREKRLDGFPFKNETRKKSFLNLWEGAASGNHLRASATANIGWPEIKLAAFFSRDDDNVAKGKTPVGDRSSSIRRRHSKQRKEKNITLLATRITPAPPPPIFSSAHNGSSFQLLQK